MGTISVSHLGKAYKQYPSRWARMLEWIEPTHKVRHHLRWVLQDINFEVAVGEAMGIIGINGAGKSTLLKMITGTTLPTTGSVSMTGRVAALLELGMGFHPDFTGRQNVVMAGQLLGYSSGDISLMMPAVEAFAEIGEYIDQPVRVYSSGMQMRLAFSVATAIRPDILIVDEALSVGDAYFVHKSLSRIRQFREQGTTLLFVSHDKAAIQSICDRAILLHEGRVAMQGEPESVMDYYNAMLASQQPQAVKQLSNGQGKVQTISGTGEVEIEKVSLLDEGNNSVEVIGVGQSVSLRVRICGRENVSGIVLGFMIKDRLGQAIFGTNTYHLGHSAFALQSGESLDCQFNFPANLGPGSYSVAVALHESDNHLERNYHWHDLALVFDVVNTEKNTFVGSNWLPVSMRCST